MAWQWERLGRSLLLGIALYLVACAPALDPPEKKPELPGLPFGEEIQEVLNQALEISRVEEVLGLSAAVIVPGYAPWSGVSGRSHPGVPISPEMVFDAGSIAKNFEAVLTLKLVEEGRLDLDEPIDTYLPAYNNVPSGVTIRQLLNHSSGIFNVHDHPDFPWIGPDIDGAKWWPIEEVFDNFVLAPYGRPGEIQRYSSTNYLLLTALIREATGESPADLVDRILLEPQQLRHTMMSMGERPPPDFTLAHPWADMDGDGRFDDLSDMPFTWKVSLTHPVLFTTPQDLVAWSQALFHDGVVLSPEAVQEMLDIPEVSSTDPGGQYYGLGVADFSESLGMRVIGHGGSGPGYSAAMIYLPDYGASLAWCLNTGESPRDLADEIMWNTWSSLSELLRLNLGSDSGSVESAG